MLQFTKAESHIRGRSPLLLYNPSQDGSPKDDIHSHSKSVSALVELGNRSKMFNVHLFLYQSYSARKKGFKSFVCVYCNYHMECVGQLYLTSSCIALEHRYNFIVVKTLSIIDS